MSAYFLNSTVSAPAAPQAAPVIELAVPLTTPLLAPIPEMDLRSPIVG
jgi:hypothetical protein